MWNATLIFSNKNHCLQKKILYRKKNSFFCGRGCKNYGSTYRAHMTAHVI